VKRWREILWGIRWAFRFGNPLEILLARHLWRRRRTVLVDVGGMEMLIDSEGSDAQALHDVLLDGMYDRAIREAAEGRMVFYYVNVGANIGAFDVRVFQLLRPACGDIAGVAVEMNPAAHARLVVNLELNRLFSIRAMNAAVWDASGTTHVRIEERDTGQSCAPAGDGEGWPVALLPWRELMSRERVIDLLKIDIEGAEVRVVPQMKAADAARIRYIVIETHGADIRASVHGHLSSIGFALLREEGSGSATCLSFWSSACNGGVAGGS
jgi:FkbM family methyltransferase